MMMTQVYKALPWKWFQLKSLNLAKLGWLVTLHRTPEFVFWFPDDILATVFDEPICLSILITDILDRNSVFHNYFPCWGGGHWGRKTLGVTWSHRDSKACKPRLTSHCQNSFSPHLVPGWGLWMSQDHLKWSLPEILAAGHVQSECGHQSTQSPVWSVWMAGWKDDDCPKCSPNPN